MIVIEDLVNYLSNSGTFILYWANFHSYTWPNTEKLIKPSGHTGGLDVRWSRGRGGFAVVEDDVGTSV